MTKTIQEQIAEQAEKVNKMFAELRESEKNVDKMRKCVGDELAKFTNSLSQGE